jgi:lysophospholipase L1-like esterase
LWLELTRDGFIVDFVGSMTGTGGESTGSQEFDSDHEGHPGWRADEVADNIEDWARSVQPDVVLVHLGTNDLAQGQPASDVIQDLTTIVDRLRVVNPHVRILLAQIIPMRADGPPDVLELNKAISALATSARTVASPVESVDHFTGFDQTGMTWDGIHPNQEGNRRMAEIWHGALLPHLRIIQEPTR